MLHTLADKVRAGFLLAVMTTPRRPRTPPPRQTSKPSFPPTPRPTPSKRRPAPVPNDSSDAEQGPKNPERVFIADTLRSNIVCFDTRGELSDANREWLKYGTLSRNSCFSDDETIRGIRAMSIDERVTVIGTPHAVIDLTELDDDPGQLTRPQESPRKRVRDTKGQKENGEGRNGKRNCGENRAWSIEEQKALWRAQVSVAVSRRDLEQNSYLK